MEDRLKLLADLLKDKKEDDFIEALVRLKLQDQDTDAYLGRLAAASEGETAEFLRSAAKRFNLITAMPYLNAAVKNNDDELFFTTCRRFKEPQESYRETYERIQNAYGQFFSIETDPSLKKEAFLFIARANSIEDFMGYVKDDLHALESASENRDLSKDRSLDSPGINSRFNRVFFGADSSAGLPEDFDVLAQALPKALERNIGKKLLTRKLEKKWAERYKRVSKRNSGNAALNQSPLNIRDQYLNMFKIAIKTLEHEKDADQPLLSSYSRYWMDKLSDDLSKRVLIILEGKKYFQLEHLLSHAALHEFDIGRIFARSLEYSSKKTRSAISQILDFFKKIAAVTTIANELPPKDALLISVYAERKLRGHEKKHAKFVHENLKEHVLPCPVILDSANQAFYILLESAESQLSTDKIVVPSIMVQKNEPAAKKIALTVTSRSLKDYKDEIERLIRYSGKRGLMGLHFHRDLPGPAKDRQASVALEFYKDNLIPYSYIAHKDLESAERKVLPFRNLLKITEDLSCGLETLHANREVHGDIKLENLLYAEEDGNARAVIADYGLTYSEKTEHPLWVGFWYGTLFYTPPEFLEKPYEQHDGKAADIYALGCCLYELTVGMLPWYEELSQLEDSGDKQIKEAYIKTPSEGNRRSYIESFDPSLKVKVVAKQMEILNILQALKERKKKGPLSQADELKLLILHLMHPDPSQRPTASQFRREIAALLCI